jgi:Bacterial Ig domain/Divergent InlB B-repeat domain/RTX calcium-binding nonapeptide repeat (4 copies)
VKNTLSNGDPETTDGAVSVRVDGLGAFGIASGPGRDALFNPPGPAGAAGTVFSSSLYLSSANDFLIDCDDGAETTTFSRSGSTLVTRKMLGSLQLDLDQRLSAISGGSSTLTQTYTLKNAATSGVSLILARHLNGDLEFDGSSQDRGVATASGTLLGEFDAGDDPAGPSTLVAISGALGPNGTPDRWTIQPFNYHDDILKTPGIPAGDSGVVHGDEDGDRLVDTPFDVTLSQQWNAGLAPGASVTFVTTTQFGQPRNRPPNAVDDALPATEDMPSSLNVLANDSDPDGDPVSFVGATAGSHGAVSCVSGVCTYTPAADYNGTDSFTYTISDGRGASDIGTVNVTVAPVDEPRQTLTVTRIGNARITSSPAGIDCGEVCSAEFELGTIVTLTATPDPGWTFSGWAGACDGSAGCVVTVDGGKSVTASFALPAPTPGQDVNATPIAGNVLVKVAGTPQFVPLTVPSLVPVGSQFDATKGRVELTAARAGGLTDTSQFYDGTFQVSQPTPTAFAELRLVLGDFSVCSLPSFTSADKNKRRVRRLWGSGKGKFRTRGRYSSATVRGTVWKTEDRCDGTLTQVQEGSVTVRDIGRKKDIVVRAGKSYLAEPLPPGVASAGCTIIGTSRGDVLRGTKRRDVICGLAGNDVIRGLGGNDKILGGPGNDRLFGGRGNDLLDGGGGKDWIDGGPGTNRVRGGAGSDRCRTDAIRACP